MYIQKTSNENCETAVGELSSTISNVLTAIARDYIRSHIAKNVVFIPASKSGIYLLRKYVFRESVEDYLSGRIIKAKHKESRESALPKPIIDFIKLTLIEKPKVNEKFIELVKFGEKNIIHGSLEYNSEVDCLQA